MVAPRSIAMAMALSGAAVFPSIDAHGWILSPAPTFLDPYGDPSKFCGVINGNKLYPADVFNRSPEDNTKAFLARFKVDYTSLKQFFDKNDDCGECGITKFGTAQKLPADGVVKWRNGGEGFVSSHEGPCEVWCDNTVVFQNDNCARNVPSGNMQIDVAKCNGAKKMVVLWIALHAVDWQVYKNCVALQDGVAPSTSAPPLTSTRPPTPSWYHQCIPNVAGEGELKTYEQCGGSSWTGKGQCKQGDECTKLDQWFSQCVPHKNP
ncbi:hypothetical protein DYB28_001164 [Aphanomyces astaci]|uniref:CBM1 domain-containing protein n=1 Tax=Aphanomyces astaci TaxID=112090 RepID=A0A9X8HBN4_APHAT|nr:hypothetical protein DYB28_001164 [Aphanomyces astaci]